MHGAIILAGGKSRRMGRNKALIELGNKPLLLHVTERVLGLVQEVVVVIGKNDDLDRYATILPSNVILLKDPIEGKGPLVGISTGMKNMLSEYVVVLSCDTPFLKKEVLSWLRQRVQGVDAAIPQWPNGDIEPLQAAYRVYSALTAAETAIKGEELLILDMIKRLDRVIYVSTEEIKKFDPELETFFNINNPKDLMDAEKRWVAEKPKP